jgi:hypothetical protein
MRDPGPSSGPTRRSSLESELSAGPPASAATANEASGSVLEAVLRSAPAQTDVVGLDAIFLPELDDKSNPLKSKGIGELGICGGGAAIANAIYNSCGVCIRSHPITLDKLILDPASPA